MLAIFCKLIKECNLLRNCLCGTVCRAYTKLTVCVVTKCPYCAVLLKNKCMFSAGSRHRSNYRFLIVVYIGYKVYYFFRRINCTVCILYYSINYYLCKTGYILTCYIEFTVSFSNICNIAINAYCCCYTCSVIVKQ